MGAWEIDKILNRVQKDAVKGSDGERIEENAYSNEDFILIK